MVTTKKYRQAIREITRLREENQELKRELSRAGRNMAFMRNIYETDLSRHRREDAEAKHILSAQ